MCSRYLKLSMLSRKSYWERITPRTMLAPFQCLRSTEEDQGASLLLLTR